MGKHPDLFDYEPPRKAPTYPEVPGFTAPGTSQESAEKMKPRAGTLRARVLEEMRRHGKGMTPDEIAQALGETVLAIRPRVTELKAFGLILDSGARRENASGHNAAVMILAPSR